jgi:pimeloyl-ACP methyl ester carboxylesterase
MVLIYAFDDEIFEPDWERFMARELLGIEPIEISGGHFPMVEDPEAVAGVLDRVSSASTRLPRATSRQT